MPNKMLDPAEVLYPQEPTTKEAAELLREVMDVLVERGKTRDTDEGEKSMSRVVNTFNALTDTGLTESDGWLFMLCLKLGRMQYGYDRDSFIDAIGYASLLAECSITE